MNKIKVAIDAGHGSNTAGKRSAPFRKNVDIDFNGKTDVKIGDQYREHYANVGVANLLYNKLISRGYDVIKTGWNDANSKDDPDEALSSRQNKIKNYKCDYSIAIHFDAFGTGEAFNNAAGVSICIHDKNAKDSKTFADFVLKELVKGSKQTNRGINPQALALCNCNTMKTKASILCELAFMTNEHEAEDLMANIKFWEESAEEIADGFENYLISKGLITDKQPEKPQEDTSLVYDYYYVKSGDTLSKIAAKYKTSVTSLVIWNKIKDINTITIGQRLIIAQYKTYTVVKGDTLKKISKKLLGTADRYKEIMDWNYLDTTELIVGQKLRIKL